MPLPPLLIAALLVGVPLVVLVQLLLQYQLTRELEEKGLHARGEVVRVRGSWLYGHHRVVEYVFFPQEGGEVRGEYKTHRSGLLSGVPSEGDPLEVLYLPDNPHRHQRVGTEVGLLGAATAVIGVVMFFFVLVFLLTLAPAKKAPEARGTAPSRRLQQYEGSPRTRPPPSGEKRQLGAY
ncbi:DUF3592 domain-containing protein [Corallococcus macrosporus]|uniref:DUF3592 domain-containing protein n=1 Tax=Corallococcus macrosporus TaxID=35 RepID=A0ABS3DGQ9_9BACT|nr:DUF3592 domain-containing protein [Corallococcus macrosporus]MBN8230495.1 DUF3592 domain-containing protein [Corallococcus macrosporus]